MVWLVTLALLYNLLSILIKELDNDQWGLEEAVPDLWRQRLEAPDLSWPEESSTPAPDSLLVLVPGIGHDTVTDLKWFLTMTLSLDSGSSQFIISVIINVIFAIIVLCSGGHTVYTRTKPNLNWFQGFQPFHFFWLYLAFVMILKSFHIKLDVCLSVCLSCRLSNFL